MPLYPPVVINKGSGIALIDALPRVDACTSAILVAPLKKAFMELLNLAWSCGDLQNYCCSNHLRYGPPNSVAPPAAARSGPWIFLVSYRIDARCQEPLGSAT
jgi:hypothetical protein